MKIKNIILDFGGVVFDHKHLAVNEYLSSKFNVNNLVNYNAKEAWNFAENKYNFLNLEFWLEYAKYLKLSDKIRHKLHQIFVYTDNTITQVEQFIKSKKLQNYRIYYLTNTKAKIFETRSQTPIFQYFDGGVTDLEAGYSKPNQEIYNFLLNKYSLIAQESVLIDDLSENILAAKQLGFNTIHFIKEVTNLELEFVNTIN